MLWSGNGQICCFFFPSLNWLTNLNIEPRLEAKIWTRTILKWHCLRFALLSVVSVRTEEFLSQSVTTLRLGLRHPPCEESPISSAVGPPLHCGKMKKGIYGMSAQGQECVHVFVTCVCVCVALCTYWRKCPGHCCMIWIANLPFLHEGYFAIKIWFRIFS